MRIDKFLKVSRVIKKREIAKELASLDRLLLNSRPCKAHSEVNIGDIISIMFGHRTITIKIKNILTSASKEEALSMYELIDKNSIKL